ncbi:ecto-ADP-ribosyltransferase 5-like [Clupea harengus]|uniref:NAD(P)(+)--arginine ADP-ribosyltransferase n=1 Tax=Clupea harengus TaxID=7950 RepID=A0A6P8EQN2_CLUHA|nr:ecto-ADP-ribosyltransferase 5-like [Clupea harengus]
MDLLIVWISMLFTAVADTRREVFPLNMAPYSVDDDYEGCSAEMSKLVDTKYLPSEISGTFEEAWRNTKNEIQGMKQQLDHLTINHAIAIRLYTHKELKMYLDLNNAVRTGKKHYTTTFMYHSLHFLLTDAIQHLNPEGACFKVYRRTDLDFTNQNPSIRFGSFTSTSLHTNISAEFGSKSCFEVLTCYGANVTKYSKHPEENEVLIPPYETFTIKEVIRNGDDQTAMKCETVYQLESSGIESNLRCAMSSSTAGREIFEL